MPRKKKPIGRPSSGLTETFILKISLEMVEKLDLLTELLNGTSPEVLHSRSSTARMLMAEGLKRHDM